MRFRSFRIPFWFLVVGILWALFSHPLLATLDKGLKPQAHEMVRSLNHFGFLFFASVILYFQIKKQNKRLLESEEQYRNLFELNPNPMWIYDTATAKFVKVNESAVDVYGYSKEEFLLMTIIDIRPDEDKERMIEFLGTIKPGVNHSGTWKHLKKNGEVVHASIVTYDLNFNNRPCRLVMATNVTDLVLKEDKIR